jgi:tetratricopeptide (TPR) repeat protein
MVGGIKRYVRKLLRSEKAAASDWVRKTEDDMKLKSLLKKAEHYEAINDPRKALDEYLNFIKLKLKLIESRPECTVRDYFELVPYYIKIGDCYKEIKHYKTEERSIDLEKAAEYYKKAAGMYLELEDYASANVYFEIASKTYEEISLYEKSAECFREIAGVYLKLGNKVVASKSYSTVGEFYEKAENYGKACEAHLKSAELSSSAGNLNAASMGYRKAAEVLRKQGRHDEAINYYVTAAELGTELGHYADVARTYTRIARDYEETNRLEDAAYYYLKSAEVVSDSDDAFASRSFKNAAGCFKRMGRYEDAIKYYNLSADMSLKLKNHLDAADSYWDMAECYENIKDYENAADFYLKNAEHASAEDKGGNYLEGYKRSAEMYSETGDVRLKDGKFSDAVKFYKKAAMSHDGLKDYVVSAGLYLRAGLIEKKRDAGDFFETCTTAAERYKMAGDPYNAAECYLEINEYMQAAKSLEEYVDKELKAENLFHSAEGYRNAGICYAELNQKDSVTESYDKAIKTYLRYIERLEKLSATEDDESNLGEAYMGIAESNRMLGNLFNAEKYFKNALDYFKKKKMKDRAVLANAFLSKVSAKIAVYHGDYPLASNMFSTSVGDFERVIKKGGGNERYLKFLRDNEEEAKEMLTEIGEKPEIVLVMDHYSYSFVDMPLRIKMTVSNNGNRSISKITFLSHLPEELEVVKPPAPVDELTAKESRSDFMELIPRKQGNYRVKLLEALYEDKKGKKYVKGSNAVSLEIVEKPVMEYKNYRNFVDSYQRYADVQSGNGNYLLAGDGYRMIAECHGEFAFRRSGDSRRMDEYCKKAMDSYLRYIDELDRDQFGQLADVEFKTGICYEATGDLLNSEKYLKRSLKNYKEAMERASREKDKNGLKLRMDTVNAFSLRVNSRKAIVGKDYETARGLLEKSVNTFGGLLEEEWDDEHKDFLKRSHRDTRDLLTGIKGN